jgi:hypothetical protein
MLEMLKKPSNFFCQFVVAYVDRDRLDGYLVFEVLFFLLGFLLARAIAHFYRLRLRFPCQKTHFLHSETKIYPFTKKVTPFFRKSLGTHINRRKRNVVCQKISSVENNILSTKIKFRLPEITCCLRQPRVICQADSGASAKIFPLWQALTAGL